MFACTHWFCYHDDRFTPANSPASANFLNLCLHNRYCVSTPLDLSVRTHRLRTLVMLLFLGRDTRSCEAFILTREGIIAVFFSMCSLSLSSSPNANCLLLFASLLPHFFSQVTLVYVVKVFFGCWRNTRTENLQSASILLSRHAYYHGRSYLARDRTLF